MPPTPVFSTEQISLRPFTPEEAPVLHAYLSHPEMAGRRYIPWKFEQTRPIPLNQAEALIDEWNKTEDGFCYAVVRNEDQAVIGHARADWGWDPHMPSCTAAVDPAHQRQGYGTQVMTLLLDYLFDFSVAHNVSNWVGEWNEPGLAFVEKLGFTNVGRFRRQGFLGGRFYDEVIFDILKPEWKERIHAA